LILIGADRSNGEYIKLARKLNIQNQVDFLGVVQSTEINEYLSQSDVFILPTRFDGWGAVLNEAASLGKPIISTDQAGAAYHLIEDGKNGFMVNAGDVKSLTKAMQYYIDKPEQISIHGKRSFEIFKNFTPEKSAELLVKHINIFLGEMQ
jgi:glycosyltransferase involved in cell wall biosynthesis